MRAVGASDIYVSCSPKLVSTDRFSARPAADTCLYTWGLERSVEEAAGAATWLVPALAAALGPDCNALRQRPLGPVRFLLPCQLGHRTLVLGLGLRSDLDIRLVHRLCRWLLDHFVAGRLLVAGRHIILLRMSRSIEPPSI